MFDTSGNGTIDKNELEQFQMRTEDIEQFDEELWNIVKPGILGPLNIKHLWIMLGNYWAGILSHYPFVKSNFEVNEDSELTTRGFITMHEAQLQQEGEEEIKTLFRIVSRLKRSR